MLYLKPCANDLYIQLPLEDLVNEKEIYRFKITDARSVIMIEVLQEPPGIINKLNLRDLSPGNYLLQVLKDDMLIQSEKIIRK